MFKYNQTPAINKEKLPILDKTVYKLTDSLQTYFLDE